MSERTYAPRSGGRTAEPRITEPRRRPSTGTEGDVRGARRQPAAAARDRGDAAVRRTGTLGVADRGAGPRTARISDSRDRAGREKTGRAAEPGRAGLSREKPGRAAEPGRETPGREKPGRTTGGRVPRGRRDEAVRGGRTAPVQGTAALKLDTAVAEPLRVTDTAATAPRLRVAPPVPISAPRAPFIAGVIALVIVGVIGILLINTKTNENSFEISRLQDQQAALDTQQQQLENQLAVYESAGNLDAAAKRLGLVKAEAPAYIRLPDGKVIGVPKPGTGRPAVTAQDAEDAAKAKAKAPEQGATQQGTTQQQATTQQGTTQQQGATQQGTTQQQGATQQGTTQQSTSRQGGAEPVTPGAGE